MVALTMLTRERRVWVTSEGIVDGKVGFRKCNRLSFFVLVKFFTVAPEGGPNGELAPEAVGDARGTRAAEFSH